MIRVATSSCAALSLAIVLEARANNCTTQKRLDKFGEEISGWATKRMHILRNLVILFRPTIRSDNLDDLQVYSNEL